MLDSSLIKAIISYAALGFVTTMASCIFLAAGSVYRIFGVILGIIMIVAGGVYGFFAFFKNDDTKKRWIYMFTCVIAVIGGIILASLPSSFHIEDSILNKGILYAVILIGITNLLSLLWPFITKILITDILSAQGMDNNQEGLIYIIVNMVFSFINGFLIAIINNTLELKKVWSQGFVYTIPVWVVSALAFAGLGFRIGRVSAPMASAYDSLPEMKQTTEYDEIK